jgi:hypothetical protein
MTTRGGSEWELIKILLRRVEFDLWSRARGNTTVALPQGRSISRIIEPKDSEVTDRVSTQGQQANAGIGWRWEALPKGLNCRDGLVAMDLTSGRRQPTLAFKGPRSSNLWPSSVPGRGGFQSIQRLSIPLPTSIIMWQHVVFKGQLLVQTPCLHHRLLLEHSYVCWPVNNAKAPHINT